MNWPQIAVIILFAISFGVNVSKHGELKKTAHFSAWTDLISTGIFTWLLYCGGFFK